MRAISSSISTSIFDVFECGPGPSSSHTIGPMKAAFEFREHLLSKPDLLQNGLNLQVKLFGSLSATGKGHGTPSAVLAGLMGHQPALCPSGLLQSLESEHAVKHNLGLADISLSYDDIEFADIVHSYPYSNTLSFSLLAKDKVLLTKTYFSVGGGFVICQDEAGKRRGEPKFKYSNMKQLRLILKESGYTLPELILENELAITGDSRVSIVNKLDSILEQMHKSVERGLNTAGVLPGTLNVKRKAPYIYDKALNLSSEADRFYAKLNSYAFATAEENAGGGVIVTAPTCGAAGLLPALIYSLIHDRCVGVRVIRESLLASTCIAFLAKHNASIAGAEVGCQGEIGVASAMGAALLVHSMGYSSLFVENAAEIALEHHLGLSCDPVGGYVQIPCIERNAVGAIKAYNASLLAAMENPDYHRVSLDSVIEAMNETGREMNSKFKETSLGGLALSMVNC